MLVVAAVSVSEAKVEHPVASKSEHPPVVVRLGLRLLKSGGAEVGICVVGVGVSSPLLDQGVARGIRMASPDPAAAAPPVAPSPHAAKQVATVSAEPNSAPEREANRRIGMSAAG